MASLNASGVSVVPKQNVGWRSQSRNIAVTSGTNIYGQDSSVLAVVQGTPPYARTAGAWGTQSNAASGSFLRQGGFVKHAESVGDSLVAAYLSGVAPASGSQGEIAFYARTPRWHNHNSARIVQRDSVSDTIIARVVSSGTRPGG